jgi:hypothetical protein
MLNLIDLIVAGQGQGGSKDGYAKAGNLTIFTEEPPKIIASNNFTTLLH